MTYQEIIRRTAANLSLTSISSAFIAIAKRDMYDVFNAITRKIQNLKLLETTTINSEDNSYLYDVNGAQIFTAQGEPIVINDNISDKVVPDDFYFPVEVVFYDTNGHQYVSEEIPREAFEKWIPDANLVTTSFVEQVTSATPNTYVWSRENEDYDGKIGYTFSDSSPLLLLWKPSVNGFMKLLYAKYADTVISTLTSSPEMHKVYHELMVLGITLKLLYRMLLEKDLTEIRLIALRSSIKLYQAQYTEMIADMTAFVEKKATFQVQQMEGFEFLNDRHMLL